MTEQQRVPVGIRFKSAGRVYYFDARGFDLDVGAYVVVGTPQGQDLGRVVVAPDQVIVSEIKETLKPIIRVAEQEDLERTEAQKKRAADQVTTVRKHVGDEGLDMQVVGGDYSLDGQQVTFYFTAEDRVDFRSLVQGLTAELDAKVQLMQVGERDRAKIVDGIGRCGERLCCSSWLTAFPSVSIRMAKDQSLPLNPSKLSGACGRLLCCLTYEHQEYRKVRGGLPKIGARLSTPTGEAKVLSISVPKETITLSVPGSSDRVEMPLAEFRPLYGTAIRPGNVTKTLDKDLGAKPSLEPVAAAPEPAPPPPERPAAKASEATDGQERPKHRRRRRRRGGRRRNPNRGSGSQ